MGYRSTIITDDWKFTFSDTFTNKYKEKYFFGKENSLPISSKFESDRDYEFEEDIAKEMAIQASNHRIFAVWLHEDGKIDRIAITKDGVFDYEDYCRDNYC